MSETITLSIEQYNNIIDTLTNERDLLKKALREKILDRSGVKVCKEMKCNLRTCGSDECIELHIAREQEGE